MRSILPFVLLALTLMGCAHPPRTAMIIRAIGPTGDTFFIPHPQPIWSFGITNTGSSEVSWNSDVEVRGGSDKEYSHAGGHIDWPEGVLAPGQGVVTNMIVPALTGSVWRAVVDYRPTTTNRWPKSQTYKDEWH